MIFFSQKGAFRQVVTKSTYRYFKTGADSEEKVPVYGITASFDPLPGQGIMLKGKLWKGKLDTEEFADRMSRLDHDVNAADLGLALMNHRNYGQDFLAFGDDGEAVEDDALLTAVGDGSFTCQCCDQIIKTKQGVAGHFGSDKHQANRAEYISDLKKQFKL